MAVWVDLVNDMAQSVKFGETTCWNLASCEYCTIAVNLLWNTVALNDHFVEFSGKNSLYLVKERSALSAQWCWKLGKFERITAAPEILLLGKVLVTKVVDTQNDVVVG